MAAIYETAYPRIKPHLSNRELKEIFTPTKNELLLLKDSTKKTNDVSRVAFMILLKGYQYLGRPINVNKIGEPIKKHIAKKLDVLPEIDLGKYPKSSRKRHIKIIRIHLEINCNKLARRQVMKATALNTAATKENLADIINRIIEELIKNHYELPAYQALVRLARAARTVINHGHYNKITEALSAEQKHLIDCLLDMETSNDDNGNDLSWLRLKQEPKKPSRNNVRDFISYVIQLTELRQKINIDVGFIAPARLEHLRDEAMVIDRSDLRQRRSLKRYALVVILIYMKSASAIDDLVQILITWMRQVESQAKYKLEEYRLKQAGKTDEFVLLLYNMLLAVKNHDTGWKAVRAIKKNLVGGIDAKIDECKEYLGLTEEKHITWMQKPYKNKRSIIFNLLDNLVIFSSTQEKSIETALAFIKHYRHSRKEWIGIAQHDLIQPNLSLLSDAFFKIVTGVSKRGETVTKVHRHYYEIAVLQTLTGDLGCSDAYVEGAFIYDDPNKQFVSWQEFALHVGYHCEIIGIPQDPITFVTLQKDRLRQTAKTVDDNYTGNAHLVINDGKPILKKLAAKKHHPETNKIKKMIMEEMPVTSIVDVIIDVERWLNLSSCFKPLSGNERRIHNYPARFVATSLSYGSNMGPTQTERCLPCFTRKQVAWLFNHHVTEQRINKSIAGLVNCYNLFALPKHWGSGESASVDGTFWDMYKQNLLAAHHIRYGRYGGVGYYHVSDQYIALFSNFISSAVHESVYLLDGLVENDSDVKPTKIHGDSWAQSEILFGLSYFLGISIMPRIKHFKHLYYYKASKKDFYGHIDELFTEQTIDWELIATHYHDMLRVAISIQQGKVKASTILRKLCSKSRKNKLYYAFRELGRVQRTIFLLNYINDPGTRRMIQAATCKSEEFNEFIDWVSFGGGGIISDNMRFSQRKIIKYTHLLANMTIFHTVVHQTKIINKLRGEGLEIPNEVLSGLSPYWREHLNRFGIFPLDMNKSSSEIEYALEDEEI